MTSAIPARGIVRRYHGYDASFGSTTLGKFSARWKVIDAVALRAHLEVTVKHLEAAVAQRLGVEDSGGVDDAVESAEAADCRGDHGQAGVVGSEVGRDRDHAPSRVTDPPRGLLESRIVAAHDGDISSGGGHGRGDLGSDSRAGAGDQDPLAVEVDG